MERAKNIFARNGKAKAGSSNTAARAGNSNTATTSSKKTAGTPEAAYLKLHVPTVFSEGDPVLLMSASHRGDMYHFRAALQVENFSVILYDSTKKTEPLEDYLAKSVLMRGKHVFIVSWTFDELHGNTPPPHPTRCFVDGQEYVDQAPEFIKIGLNTYGEKAATKIIASAPNRFQDVVNGMTILDVPMADNKFPDFNKLSDKHREISKGFERLWVGWKKDGVEAGKNAILLMHRDTGTSGGVYPELDNGDANAEIGRIVSEISEKNKPLTVFTCGVAISATRPLPAGELHGIGKYWEAVDKLNPNDKQISPRDFQAYFLKWSHRNNYFKMATGFRSGGLDLCTFMGIPTVSIGLRNLMGESRHQLLADERFKRVNIQYDQPRHKATAAVVSKRWEPEPGQTVFGSPFWGDDFSPPPDAEAKRDMPQNKTDAQKQNPRTFAPFDRVVVKTGYIIALQKYMEWGQTISSLKKTLPCTVTTSTARLCYPFKVFGNQTAITKYFDENERLDQSDISRVQRKLKLSPETLQLSKSMFGKYVDDYNNDWKDIQNLIDGQAKALGRGITWKRKLRIDPAQ
ncbi:hypothetical protein HDV63DRAFT_234113 [Trichoderma sp. SZMC 28014]